MDNYNHGSVKKKGGINMSLYVFGNMLSWILNIIHAVAAIVFIILGIKGIKILDNYINNKKNNAV